MAQLVLDRQKHHQGQVYQLEQGRLAQQQHQHHHRHQLVALERLALVEIQKALGEMLLDRQRQKEEYQLLADLEESLPRHQYHQNHHRQEFQTAENRQEERQALR